MNQAEYEKKSAELLSDVPAEFHKPLQKMAYDHGHSAGYHEILNYLSDFVHDLAPAIKAYIERVNK